MLKIKGLRKSFGSVIAADNIDLSVAPGEALGIIGPNGAGKTTLFNLIAGGLAPDAGEIRLNGRDITAVKAASALHRRNRTLLSDPAAVRESHRVRESAGGCGAWRGHDASAPPPRPARKFSNACI